MSSRDVSFTAIVVKEGNEVNDASEVNEINEVKMSITTLHSSKSNASPFLLKVQDVESLSQSDGFNILREHLAQHCCYDLCDKHTPAHLEDNSRWLIVRDVLHALLVPVVELFDKALNVATASTHASRLEDLEYAFTGQARSAFVWLQCFLSSEKERDWCYTRGCPACIVDRSLDSEFSIRLLYAACLLSDVHYPFTLEGPTLPSFMFFLDSLQQALVEDPIWGKDFFEATQPKAVTARNGIEDLIHQCIELDAMLSQPSSAYGSSSPVSSVPASPALARLGCDPMTSGRGLKVKKGKIVQRQMKLHVEEEQWTEETLKRCWDQLEPAGAECLMGLPEKSQDNVLKGDAAVAVNEVPPGG